jgi:KUP system potassium uptake protein
VTAVVAGTNGNGDHGPSVRHSHGPLYTTALGALGVVFGDIGTSPLYTLKSCLEAGGGSADRASVLGLLSLIFWALFLVITVKYVLVVLRADNRGEGGALALMALVIAEGKVRRPAMVAFLALIGCALFYGDGSITPAISVLSAIEGLKIAEPTLDRAVIPLSVICLLALFAFQRRGTGAIGALFGPVMLVWFATLAALGLTAIVRSPVVLLAVNPWHAAYYLVQHRVIAVAVLGAVFLAVTGGEALYADLGHFGKRPIRVAWCFVAWPALVLNYLGQGALLLTNPRAAENPFFLLAPGWLLMPLVFLATAATIIASQAVISGVFSVSQQAQQLGFLPRIRVLQTSAHSIGQIYVPAVNAVLCVTTVGLVLAFRASDALGNAYGIAVSGTMVIQTTLLVLLLLGRRDDARERMFLAVALPMGLVDLMFFTANAAKIPAGGWFPVLFGLCVLLVMRTWLRGRQVVSEQMRRQERSISGFLAELERQPPRLMPGTAVFLSSNTEGIPRTLARNVRYNGVLHEHTVLCSVVTARIPRVPRGGRTKCSKLADHLYRIECQVGFMERADVPRLLRDAERAGLGFRTDQAAFFLGRDDIVIASPRGMARWRKHLFVLLARNSEFAGSHFGLPPERIIELGGQVQI